MSGPRTSTNVVQHLSDRFTEKYTIDEETGCWEWRGNPSQRYGAILVGGRPLRAHRVIFEALVGPIPEGLELDHLCCNSRCVNPAHLEPVTSEENRRRQRERQTHCKHGHPLSGENLVLVRVCRTCSREREARHVAKRRKERQS